jgi:hypothetical protein
LRWPCALPLAWNEGRCDSVFSGTLDSRTHGLHPPLSLAQRQAGGPGPTALEDSGAFDSGPPDPYVLWCMGLAPGPARGPGPTALQDSGAWDSGPPDPYVLWCMGLAPSPASGPGTTVLEDSGARGPESRPYALNPPFAFHCAKPASLGILSMKIPGPGGPNLAHMP